MTTSTRTRTRTSTTWMTRTRKRRSRTSKGLPRGWSAAEVPGASLAPGDCAVVCADSLQFVELFLVGRTTFGYSGDFASHQLGTLMRACMHGWEKGDGRRWDGKGASLQWPHPGRPGDPSSEGPAHEISTRRFREQSQLDFELDFIGRILERDPYFTEALRVHATTWPPRGICARVAGRSPACSPLARAGPPLVHLACSYAVLE